MPLVCSCKTTGYILMLNVVMIDILAPVNRSHRRSQVGFSTGEISQLGGKHLPSKMKVYTVLLVLVCLTYCYAAKKNFGDACTKDDKCQEDTECRMLKNCKFGTCQCERGYTRKSGNTCKKLKKVGDSCKASSDCYGGDSSVSCSSGKCKCAAGMSVTDNKKGCAIHVGDKCKANADCDKGVVMECKNSMCTCKAAFKEEKRLCVPYLLGEDCTGGKTCLAGACRENKCKCGNNMEAYLGRHCIDKKAKKDLAIGEKCTNFTVSGAAGLFCEKGLMCLKCPNENLAVCESAAISIKASFLMGILGFILAFLRL